MAAEPQVVLKILEARKEVKTGFRSWLGMADGVFQRRLRQTGSLIAVSGSWLWEISFKGLCMGNGVKTVLAGQKVRDSRNSSVALWLRLHAFTAKGAGSIPGQETEIPQDTWPKRKEKRYSRESELVVVGLEKEPRGVIVEWAGGHGSF